MARVAFCQDTLIEYMGFMQMSAVLKADGHQVDVFFDDRMDRDRFVLEVSDYEPDIVCFSVLTPSRSWAVETATAVGDACGAMTVCGNVDVILNPHVYADSNAFDLVCTGEGEFAMSELCAAVDEGADWREIRGFWAVDRGVVFKNDPQPGLVDMDELPPVDRGLYDRYRFFRRSPYLRVYAGRGCPYKCSFCANEPMTEVFGGGRNYWRKRSPERFVADLEELIASRPNRIKRLYIIDEVLWLDRRWLTEFLDLYTERIRIPFSVNFKFNGGVREEDVQRLAAAGAACFVATETGDEELRTGLMNKPVSNQHILQVTGWMRKHGVEYGSSAFFGLPGQSFDKHIEELEFFRRVRPKYLWTTFFQPYPGVRLTENPDVAKVTPEAAEFRETLHNEPYLEVADRTRLVNLKKVYFLMCRFPRSTRPLAWLTRFRLPLVFDALWAAHFLWYALWAEGCSPYQLMHHVKNFAINPALRRMQPLNVSGRSHDIGYDDTSRGRLGSRSVRDEEAPGATRKQSNNGDRPRGDTDELLPPSAAMPVKVSIGHKPQIGGS